MATITDAIDQALGEIDRLRTLLRKKKSPQVWSAEERSLIKATAQTWYKSHRDACSPGSDTFKKVDAYYDQLLRSSDRAGARKTYQRVLKDLRLKLIDLRSEGMVTVPAATTDNAPAFGTLIPDPAMQKILEERWKECAACIGANAPLAATVMMGGLVEALLLARIHREPNRDPIFSSPKAPKDKAGKTRPLQEWGLKDYIDVANDLKWITYPARDVAEVVRDYRNFVHPYKQHTHGIVLVTDDAQLFWEVTKAICRQVIKSAGP